MRVFVTGASGHLGSAVVPELLSAGHEVVGLARSETSAAALTALGAEVRPGDLDDLGGLREAAADADGVIHLAFKHDAMVAGDYASAVEADLAALRAFREALAGTGKPFVGTSGTGMLSHAPEHAATEPGRAAAEDVVLAPGPGLLARAGAENLAVDLAGSGIRSSVVRLPPTVHSELDRHGFVPMLIATARATGVSGYLGDGGNRWPAVHTLDAARVYRLALEQAPAGSRLHAVGDEGVPFRQLAEAIGRHLDVPVAAIPAERAQEHFGFLAGIVPLDNPTSSERTRRLLGWQPAHPGLLADLDLGHYFAT
ncbi:SDR family oxidoreductase [Nonomuraea gerenzanensis]|uniref:Putative oxidoreductase n=1 Tax=Nonomuraea gerenzanensis TaxID=93944 RepID=A0A1M4DXR3_9ACTN|nr:SDR family oxidoreductase [Nonomuraea gerenzanensis]UBU13703.1 SDR family oxidoreductase [Nonomuraea gerenzanensis]SBO91371.1 putative oxidoreductase [Nonomuraea gerenzanensis]